MIGFSKLGIALSIVFSLLLFALLAEIFFLLWRRRRHFHRKQARVEPAGATIYVAGDPDVLRLEGINYGPSRVLYTIKEELEEVETEVCSPVGDAKTELLSQLLVPRNLPEVIVVVGHESDNEVEPPFLTPCVSPPYLTPSSSPSRERK